MKKVTSLFLIILSIGVIQTKAQKSANNEVKKIWEDIYLAYNNGDYEKGISFYADNAVEISPDGSITSGIATIKSSWEAFEKMIDEKPSFKNSEYKCRFITNDTAIITWKQSADLKIQGQQMGGDARAIAVLHKTNGKWKIEADATTPIMDMSAH